MSIYTFFFFASLQMFCWMMHTLNIKIKKKYKKKIKIKVYSCLTFELKLIHSLTFNNSGLKDQCIIFMQHNLISLQEGQSLQHRMC